MLIMRAGGLLNVSMAMAPVACLVFLGAQSRGTAPMHVILTPPEEGQRAITAFVEPVRRVVSLGLEANVPDRAPNPEARAVAAQWNDGWSSGALRPLPRLRYEDSARDGYRGAIFAKQRALIDEIEQLADQAERQGRRSQAIEDWVTVVELARILRYDDLVSACSHALTQLKALHHIEALGPPEAGQLARLQSALNGLDPLESTARLLEREYRLFVIGEDVPAQVRTEQQYRVRDFSHTIRQAYRRALPQHISAGPARDARGNAIGLMMVARKAATHACASQRVLERLTGRRMPIGAEAPASAPVVASRR